MDPKVVISADPLVPDPDLRGGFDAVLFHERVGFLTRGQRVILDFETLALQQVLGFEPIGTEVVGHHHPVKLGCLGCCLLACHILRFRVQASQP